MGKVVGYGSTVRVRMIGHEDEGNGVGFRLRGLRGASVEFTVDGWTTRYAEGAGPAARSHCLPRVSPVSDMVHPIPLPANQTLPGLTR